MSSPLCIMDIQQEHPPAPPAVRIRINKKMPRPLAYQNLDRVRSKLDMCKQMWKVNRSNMEKYINWRRAEVRTHGVSADYYAVRRQVRLEWLNLSGTEKSNWAKAFTLRELQAAQVTVQPWMLPEFDAANAPPPLVKDFSLAPGCLFTFNNGWLLDKPDWCDLVKDLQDSPAELVKQARKREDTMALFDRFSVQADCFARWAGWQDWSVSLEISLDAEDLGRVHLHAFASFGVSNFLVGRKAFRFGFDQLYPDRRWCKGRKGPGGKEKALRDGHYYLQAPKIGQIAMKTTWPKFSKMPVNSSAVKDLWRKRKINTRDAKVEIVQCRDRTPAMLREIEDTMQAEYRIQADFAWKTGCLGWGESTAKEETAKEMEWLEQFRFKCSSSELRRTPAAIAMEAVPHAMSGCRQRRFKLLIYDGPSGYGKTERATRWFGSDRTLTIQCKNITTPNLRDWQTGDYEAMVFDEGDWSLVSTNRALFQAGPRPIQMSQSQCNDRCYTLHVDACPMVVTSNDFWEGCTDWSAWEWIRQNSVYIYIDCKQYNMT
mgnify:CR=1 FL=1